MEVTAPPTLLDLPRDYMCDLFDYVRSYGYRWLRSFYCTHAGASDYKAYYIERSVSGMKPHLLRRLGDQYESIASIMASYSFQPFLKIVPCRYADSTSSVGLFFLFPSTLCYSSLFASDSAVHSQALYNVLSAFSTSEYISFIASSLDISMDRALYYKVFYNEMEELDYSSVAKVMMLSFVWWTMTYLNFSVDEVVFYWRHYVYLHIVYFLMGPVFYHGGYSERRCEVESYDGFSVGSLVTKLSLNGDRGLVPVYLGIVFRTDGDSRNGLHGYGPDITMIDEGLFSSPVPIPHVPINKLEERNLDALMSFIWHQ